MNYDPKPGEDRPAQEERKFEPGEGYGGHVIIDPSLIVAQRTHDRTFNQISEADSYFRFYLPVSFREAVSNRERDVLQFFLDRGREVGFNDLETNLREYDNDYSYYSAEEDKPDTESYDSFRNDLEDVLPNIQHKERLVDIVFQEAYFLLEKSWLISRLKKNSITLKEQGSQ